MRTPFATLNSELEIFDDFRKVSGSKIKYQGNFFRCRKIEKLLKSRLYKKSWIDSSKNSRPDFHNDKHHIMMEVMKVDDCANPATNSFHRKDKCLKIYFGNDYKDKLNNCTTIVVPDTTDDKEYNFEGYFNNFKRVIMDHSIRVDKYRDNFPKCKTCVFLICDESNGYYQQLDSEKNLVHLCFNDARFLEIIKECNADFVVWYTPSKVILNLKQREIRFPLACIYDVKNMVSTGYKYSAKQMLKVK